MIGFLHFGLMWGHPGKKLLFMGGEYLRWTREHSCIEGEELLRQRERLSDEDCARYAEHCLKMVPAITEQNRVAFNAKWRPNGEDLRMQFADHVGSSKCKWNDAGRLGTKRGGLR